MTAVLRHELALAYHSLTGYVFGAFLLIFTGIGAMLYNINASVANFEYVLHFISMIFILIIPILTMRVIAEEKRQKTDQLLSSLPISSTEIVTGKFFALGILFLIPVLIISLYPLLFSRFGEVYLPTAYGSLLAFFLMGLALISIGVFLSSLTESQGMAAGLSAAVMLFLYYSASLAESISATETGALIGLLVTAVLAGLLVRSLTRSDLAGLAMTLILAAAVGGIYILRRELLKNLLPDLLHRISPFERFTVFVNGVLDLTSLVYYLSLIVFFLFLTVQSLEKRRYSGS